MANLVDVCEGCSALHNMLTLRYGKGYNVSVVYCEVNQVYIANVKNSNDKDVRGFLFDLSQQQIQAPRLEHIEEKDSILYGSVKNKEHRLDRKVKDNHITYDFAE